MIRWLIALSMSAGCIVIPDEQTGVADDAGIDAAVPDMMVDCSLEATTCISEALNGGTVYTAITAHLNNDEFEDLIVTHTGGNPGFFVTYGPLNHSDGQLEYDEHILTDVQPIAVTAENVTGDGDSGIDIIVFGPTLASPNSGVGQIEIYANNMEGSPRFSNRIIQVTAFTPLSQAVAGDRPVHVLVESLGGTQQLVVADLQNIEIFDTDSLSTTGVLIGPNGATTDFNSWSAINKLFPYSGGLLIVEEHRVTHRTTGGLMSTEIDKDFTVRTAELFDLDGDDNDDLLGAGFNTFGAYLNSSVVIGSGYPDTRSELTLAQQNIVDIWQLSIVPFDTNKSKLVYFEQLPGTQDGTLYSSPLSFNDGTDVLAITLNPPIPLGFIPVVAVVTASGEYRVLSDNGQSRCFVPSEDTLVPCSQ